MTRELSNRPARAWGLETLFRREAREIYTFVACMFSASQSSSGGPANSPNRATESWQSSAVRTSAPVEKPNSSTWPHAQRQLQTQALTIRNRRTWAALAVFLLCSGLTALAGSFPGTADLQITDPTGALSWNTNNNALTIQCWFKISIPTGTNPNDNIVVLVNGTGGAEQNYAYQIRYNIFNGNVEFLSHGTGGGFTNALISNPYLDRWYHVAVVQQAATFTGYLDGRQVFTAAANVGNSACTNGVSVGGWGSGKYFYGEVQELSIYQNALSQDFIVQNMFNSQPTNDPTLGLVGYFPLGYSTTAGASLANVAPGPVPSGTSAATQRGTGTVTFEETDEAGEQSAFDSQRNGGRDALVPLSGAFSWQQTALSRPTPGIAFDFRFAYSSANAFGGFQLGGHNPYSSGPLGAGWRHTFETRLIPSQDFSPLSDTDTIGLMNWDGSIETWDLDLKTEQYMTRDKEYDGELLFTTTNCQWTTPKRIVYVFNRPDTGNAVMRGRLTSIRDFNGNAVQILWNQFTGVITQVVDTADGTYNFYYQRNLLTNVSFNSWVINFAYDATNRLISKSLTNSSGLYGSVNTQWRFLYGTNGLLAQVVDPRGNTNVAVEYDEYGRYTRSMDAIGRVTQTLYGVPGTRQITHIDPAANLWIEAFDRKGRVLVQTDPLTNSTTYTYDDFGNRTSITQPLGWTTYFGYDTRGNVVARTNALGEVTRWAFHGFFNKATNEVDAAGWTNCYTLDDSTGNTLAEYDALGVLMTYEYKTNGLVASAVDADGNTNRYFYDTNGFPIFQVDAAGYTNATTYNDVGWQLSASDALGQTTLYSRDLNGKTIRVVDPLGRNFISSYDGDGNLLSRSDGKGQMTTFGYDAAGQKINETNRDGSVWNYVYTPLGKVQRAIDPLGETSTNFYDSANRLVSVADAMGNAVGTVYDGNGNTVAVIDPTGRRWSKLYDRVNRVVAEFDPLGNTRLTFYDAVGRVSQIVTPNKYRSLHYYDGRGRLTNWVDTAGFQWNYIYDGVGNIVDIEDALHGHYIMHYGPRNERILEQNQDTNVWHYYYDPLLRLSQLVDPNGTSRTNVYDPGGRLAEVDFSTGRRDVFAYDDNNNANFLVRSGSGPLSETICSYDTMDRISTSTDPFNNKVDYGYDAVGRTITLTYPGGRIVTNRYDPAGRLTNQVDWAGNQMQYTYDQLGRLLTRSYPNGIVQSNAFDSGGHITSLSYESSGDASSATNGFNIALRYGYDRNGNRVRETASGNFKWPTPSLRDQKATFTPSGELINRIDSESATNDFVYRYDRNGNLTNATSAGQDYLLTYDENDLVTSVHWRCGALIDEIITNQYDALGHRVARTQAGIITKYVFDVSSYMPRILGESDANGVSESRNIFGPDLCYTLDLTNGLSCYHDDSVGNVISMTRERTNVLAEYAYTPYGRSFCSTNYQKQILNPYRFVGARGVMEDLPDLYFMGARYYLASVCAFVSRDPQQNIGPEWMPTAYAYVGGNPLRRTDPTGRSWLSASVGLIASGYSTYETTQSPVTFGLLVGGAILVDSGFALNDHTLMRHGDGLMLLPFSERKAEPYLSDDPAKLSTLETVIHVVDLVGLALNIGEAAQGFADIAGPQAAAEGAIANGSSDDPSSIMQWLNEDLDLTHIMYSANKIQRQSSTTLRERSVSAANKYAETQSSQNQPLNAAGGSRGFQSLSFLSGTPSSQRSGGAALLQLINASHSMCPSHPTPPQPENNSAGGLWGTIQNLFGAGTPANHGVGGGGVGGR